MASTVAEVPFADASDLRACQGGTIRVTPQTPAFGGNDTGVLPILAISRRSRAESAKRCRRAVRAEMVHGASLLAVLLQPPGAMS